MDSVQVILPQGNMDLCEERAEKGSTASSMTILMKFYGLILYFSLKCTCILLQSHSEEEEYLQAVQKPKVMKKKWSSICKTNES